MCVLGGFAYAGGGFADNFQDFEYRVAVEVALHKLLISKTFHEHRGLARRDEHVEQVGVILPHR